jgi:hypothetical protein
MAIQTRFAMGAKTGGNGMHEVCQKRVRTQTEEVYVTDVLRANPDKALVFSSSPQLAFPPTYTVSLFYVQSVHIIYTFYLLILKYPLEFYTFCTKVK